METPTSITKHGGCDRAIRHWRPQYKHLATSLGMPMALMLFMENEVFWREIEDKGEPEDRAAIPGLKNAQGYRRYGFAIRAAADSHQGTRPKDRKKSKKSEVHSPCEYRSSPMMGNLKKISARDPRLATTVCCRPSGVYDARARLQDVVARINLTADIWGK